MSRTVIPFAYKLMIMSLEPVKAPLTLADQLRLEGAVAVPRGSQVEIADLVPSRLRRRPVHA